jgi:hypothetical protein
MRDSRQTASIIDAAKPSANDDPAGRCEPVARSDDCASPPQTVQQNTHGRDMETPPTFPYALHQITEANVEDVIKAASLKHFNWLWKLPPRDQFDAVTVVCHTTSKVCEYLAHRGDVFAAYVNAVLSHALANSTQADIQDLKMELRTFRLERVSAKYYSDTLRRLLYLPYVPRNERRARRDYPAPRAHLPDHLVTGTSFHAPSTSSCRQTLLRTAAERPEAIAGDRAGDRADSDSQPAEPDIHPAGPSYAIG